MQYSMRIFIMANPGRVPNLEEAKSEPRRRQNIEYDRQGKTADRVSPLSYLAFPGDDLRLQIFLYPFNAPSAPDTRLFVAAKG
jgi:hypothetical protein